MGIVELKNVSRVYRNGDHEQRALDHVDLSLEEGKFIVVLGPSGAGKSTLLNLLGGLDRPDPGCGARIEVAGRDLLGAGERGRARLRAEAIGFVFQSFHLLPELTIEENVRLPAMALPGFRRAAADAHARELLEAAGLGDRLGHRPAELSGGERQRVAVARALMNGPALLLADEPTGNLDALTGRQILDLVFDLGGARSDAPPALVMVTHSDATAARCDRTLRLEGGVLA